MLLDAAGLGSDKIYPAFTINQASTAVTPPPTRIPVMSQREEDVAGVNMVVAATDCGRIRQHRDSAHSVGVATKHRRPPRRLL
jgi:hypothetical protein